MPQIVPIRDLKDTTAIADLCKRTKEPVFITKNGYGEMVIMSMDAYEELLGKIELYHQIAISEKQLEEGKFSDADEVAKRIKEKYGL